MRVLLDTSVIAGGGHESPSGFTLSATPVVQMVDYIRSPYGAQLPRRNLRHEVSFRVTRLHGSQAKAAKFILDHPQSLPLSGLLQFLFDDLVGGGGGRWLRDAVRMRTDLVLHAGLTTVWAYAFVGGEMLTKNPKFNPSAGRSG